MVESLGYKGAIAAADELKGLLEGSKVAGTRKGLTAQQQAAFSSLPQVRGWDAAGLHAGAGGWLQPWESMTQQLAALLLL